ncbi:MAG TPA: FlgD immunoglobulin-like domain containing protein [bacterium]|nr:FlgD immunoglobulin-like domain containing protein [bacterium]
MVILLSAICLASGADKGVSVRQAQHGSESGWSAKASGTPSPEYPDTIVATIPCGGVPENARATLDGKLVYILDGTSDSVTVVRTWDNSIAATFHLAGRPSFAIPSPDGQYMFISSSQSRHTVSKVRISDDTIVGQIRLLPDPHDMTFVQNGEYLYVSIFRSHHNQVAVLRTSDCSLVGYITVGADPSGIVATADGQHCYVACAFSDSVYVLRTSDNTIEAMIPTHDRPVDVALSPAGDLLYVACEVGDCVDVIRTSDRQMVTSIPVSSGPDGLALSPNGEYLYASAFWMNCLSIIKTSDYSIVKELWDWNGPRRGAFLPDGSMLYVPTANEGCVKVVGNSDVGPTAILSPAGTRESASVCVPRAVVRGLGLTSTVFPVTMNIGSDYSQTIQETLAAREDTVVFPPWTARLTGTLPVMCFTSLGGDENTTNDTIGGLVQVVPPPRHDVGAVAILAPPGLLRAGDTVMPKVRIKNFGNTAERLFGVQFRISTGYNQTVTVTQALSPDSTMDLTYSEWIAPPGQWAVSCSTMLGNDMNRANDKVSSSVQTYAQSLQIGPDQSDQLQAGQDKTYRFYALVQGDTGGVVELKMGTVPLSAGTRGTVPIFTSEPPGWSLRLCNATGAKDLTDTDGDGIPDLGYVAPGETSWFSLDVTASAGLIGDTASLAQRTFLIAGHLGNDTLVADTAVLNLTLMPGFSIHNFPNPFSTSTSFVIGLPEAGKVSLTIYTRAGERVRRMVTSDQSPMTAGVHILPWDGTNDNGRRAAPGTYEYVLDYVHGDKTDRIHKRLVVSGQ